jgi:RimJ/RimL family protein N-acetyltransferase
MTTLSDKHFFAPDELVTPDFTIRSYQPGDGVLTNDAVNSSYDHLRTFLMWAQPHTELDESEALVRRFRAQYLTNEDYVLGIFAPDGKRQLGGTGFHLRGGKAERKTAEIGMWIRADAASGGLGTSVLKMLLKWGFETWGWERLYWRADTRNIGSIRVAEKAGMIREGIQRGMYDEINVGQRTDYAVYSLLLSDWQKG